MNSIADGSLIIQTSSESVPSTPYWFGEVVRTRTVISQAHSSQWLGSFGNRGNGLYRVELRQALSALGRYLVAHQIQPECALLRLDGQYGTGAVLADLAGFAFVARGKDYTVLDHPLVQARLHLPPDQFQHRPESQVVRSLYDCASCACGVRGRAVPRGGGDPSRRHKEEPGWPHALGRRLRTLLHRLAAAGVHRLRRRRSVSASWRLRTCPSR